MRVLNGGFVGMLNIIDYNDNGMSVVNRLNDSGMNMRYDSIMASSKSSYIKCAYSFLIGLIILVSFDPSIACENIDGLFEKRNQMRYSQEEKESIKEIDLKYRRIISDLFYEYERSESTLFDQCSDYYMKDEVLFPVCVLMKYYRDKDAKVFITSLAHNNEKLSSMWLLEEIVYFTEDAAIPATLKEGRLPYIIVNEIRTLASQGDKGALDFLFSLNADGGNGTNLDVGICGFMHLYPDVIVENWETVKKYSYRMHSVLDVGCIRVTEPLRNAYIKVCDEHNVDPASLKEILSLFENNKNNR